MSRLLLLVYVHLDGLGYFITSLGVFAVNLDYGPNALVLGEGCFPDGSASFYWFQAVLY